MKLALSSWRRVWAWAWVLVAGWGRGASTGLGGCLAAVLNFCRVAGAGFAGWWAFAAVGALAVGTGLGARLGGFPCGLGGAVLDEDVVVVADEVAVVVEFVESEAEERDVGDMSLRRLKLHGIK